MLFATESRAALPAFQYYLFAPLYGVRNWRLLGAALLQLRRVKPVQLPQVGERLACFRQETRVSNSRLNIGASELGECAAMQIATARAARTTGLLPHAPYSLI